jgi:hypothetical protein|tara:strand:- start:1205 stop:1354 length:150 start_codon:yes stop_codon:yes gene_type:complete
MSQGNLNGKITRCKGSFKCFEAVVKDYPREMRVRGYRHFLMFEKLKANK